MDSTAESEESVELFRCVENIIGKKPIIDNRRVVTRLYNEIWDTSCQLDSENSMLNVHFSGSHAEGFRLKTSDIDLMCIVNNVKLYTSEEDARNSPSDENKLLVECETDYPGFAKLKLLSEPNDSYLRHLCIPYDSSLYLCNSRWKSIIPKVNVEGDLHGPCQSGILGMSEIDLAVCFHSKGWPVLTHNFIKRLYKVGWPSPSVLESIVNQGCHFVAIGFPESQHEDLEWRISFSFTEEVLIHEMNHCQFLCYGLLKIFLKECIDIVPQLEGLLCSYFMKTLIFWEMTSPSLSWTESSFLQRFWSCIKRLIHYVQVGYLPSFFIPENNMIARKVKGKKREELLAELRRIYTEGNMCLKKMPSILKIFEVIRTPICTKSEINFNLLLECFRYPGALTFLRRRTVMDMLCIFSRNESNLTETQRICLKILSHFFYQDSIIYFACSDEEKWRNKVTWRKRIRRINTLNKFPVDSVKHTFYTILYLYRIGCYQMCIKIIQHAKSKLQNPQTISLPELKQHIYRAAGGEHKSIFNMLKNIVYTIGIGYEQCIPELRPEFEDVKNNSIFKCLTIPPMVLGHFLLYLCYRHEGNDHEAKNTLEEFNVTVKDSINPGKAPDHLPICYNMLAICQELHGDYRDAEMSYKSSIRCQYNKLEDSTNKRLKNLKQLKSRAVIN